MDITRVLNNMTPGSKRAKLGDRIAALEQAAGGGGTVDATNVTVSADATNGVSAGNLQATISALAARIKALEDAN